MTADIKDDIKNAGLKVTLPRTKILELLESSVTDKHLSAEEIYKILLDDGFDIGIATVYRVLTQFEKAGLVVRHKFKEGSCVFELHNNEHHDHLVCIECGVVQEFIDEMIEKRQAEIAKLKSFQMTDHSLYIFGRCKDCQ